MTRRSEESQPHNARSESLGGREEKLRKGGGRRGIRSITTEARSREWEERREKGEEKER